MIGAYKNSQEKGGAMSNKERIRLTELTSRGG